MTFDGLAALVGRMSVVGAFRPWDVKFHVDHRETGARLRVVIWVPNGYGCGKTNVAIPWELSPRQLKAATPERVKSTVRHMLKKLVIHEMDECFYAGKFRAFNPHRSRSRAK